YRSAGIVVTDDLGDCSVLLGVKEVPISQLIPEKTYFFFSHTIKQQPYNQKLLWAVLEKNIRLIDYEVLTDEHGARLIAFGRFAGMVGAHNALWTWGQRTHDFSMPRMKDFHDYKEAVGHYKTMKLPALKIVLTGTGRVSTGAADVLLDMGIEQVSPTDFLEKSFENPVFTQLSCQHYVARKDGKPYQKENFYHHPHSYKSIFAPYHRTADIFINGIFYDKNAPAFFTVDEMAQPDFKIKVIADVSCDIAPEASVPSTLKASTIADPVFGFDPKTSLETAPFLPNCIDMMTIDNLPNEMPRDASESFGNQFLERIMPELVRGRSRVISHATIAQDGHLTSHFRHLEDYANADIAHQQLA
ncbi:MAG: NAD(P)-dependent oxidoreductase, partial [Saprospiraceae bacterium]|nr:NAD(P)-dependent oxidoreductase [Saprospiraceae bacterium]